MGKGVVGSPTRGRWQVDRAHAVGEGRTAGGQGSSAGSGVARQQQQQREEQS